MAKSKYYQERFYRQWVNSNDLIRQEVIVDETDIFVSSEKDVKEIAERIVQKYRDQIEYYIRLYPGFKTTLAPFNEDPLAPDIIKDMIHSSGLAKVGPMASVAGAISEFVGRELLFYSKQVIIENGGDIFIKSDTERTIGIFAGESPLTNKLFIRVRCQDTPISICTSSGTIGHSLSFGKADACVIISTSASLADAVSTSACNRVKEKGDIRLALDFSMSIEGVRGALIVFGKEFGVRGEVELV